jgi:hypothetical protein
MNTSYVGAIVGAILFLLVHVGTLIWFMSRISILVGVVQRDLTKLESLLDSITKSNYTITDAARDFAYRDRELKAIWAKMDKINA